MKNSKFFLTTLFAAAALAVPETLAEDYTLSYSTDDTIDLSSYTSSDTVTITASGGYLASGTLTFACNIVIGDSGFTLDNGYSSAVYTFSGTISGSGNWTHTASPTQKYIFTGDLSNYSGDLTKTNQNSSYFYFGNNTTAATNTAVSGTGALTISGTVRYYYSGYASSGASALTIENTSISANTLLFQGSVNYAVSSNLSAYTSTATVTVSNTGTTTTSGDISGFASITVSSGSTLVLSAGTVTLSSAISNSGTLTFGSDVVLNLTEAIETSSSGTTTIYTVFSNSGTISGFNSSTLSAANLQVDGVAVSGRSSISFSASAGTITIDSEATASTLIWAGGESGDWDYTSYNWTVNGSSELFISGDNVEFETDSAVVTLTNSYAAGTITISADTEFTANSAVTLSATSVTVSAGTLKIDSNVSLKLTGSGLSLSGISGTGAISFTASSDYDSWDFGSTFSGTVSVSGTEILLASASGTGGSGMTLQIGDSSSTGTFTVSSNVTIEAENVAISSSAGATSGMEFNLSSGSLTFTGSVSGDAFILSSGSNALTFTGGISSLTYLTFTGTTTAVVFGGEDKEYNITYVYTRSSGTSSRSLTIESGATLNIYTLGNSYGLTSLVVDGTLNASSVINYSSGSQSQTITGAGTINAVGFGVANAGTYSVSVNRMNLGASGIYLSSTDWGYSLSFSGVTFGVLDSATSWTSSLGFSISNATFDVDSGKTISLTGSLSYSGTLTKTGAGTTTFSTAISASDVTVSEGTLTFSSTLTASGTVTISGTSSKLTVSSTLTANALRFESGTLSVAGSYAVENIYLGDGISLTISSGKLTSTNLYKTGAGTLTINGTNSLSGTILASGGTTTIANAVSATSISVSGTDPTLNLNSASTSTAVAAVSLNGAKLPALDSGTLTFGSKISLSIYDDSTLNSVVISGATVLLDDEVVTTLTGSTSFSSGTIDLSAFTYNDGNTVNVFYVGSGLSGTSLVSQLSALTLAGSTTGTWAFDSSTNYITFTSDALWRTWSTDFSSKSWTTTKFGDENFTNKVDSVTFGDLDGGTETVKISNAEAVSVVVNAGDGGVYTFTGTLTVSGALSVKSGELVSTGTITASKISVSGGTLTGAAASSLNLEDAENGSFRISKGGTVSLQNASATNATTISLSGASTLEFVEGALANVSTISISSTSESERAVLTWLSASVENIFSKIDMEAGSHVEFNISQAAGTLTLSAGTGSEISTSGTFYKTGAGTISIEELGLLYGTLVIEEGAVSFGATGANLSNFAGDVIITGTSAVLIIAAQEAFGSSSASSSEKTTSLTITNGGTLQLGSESTDNIPNLTLRDMGDLILGDGASVIDGQSYDTTSSDVQFITLNLSGTNVKVLDDSAATISAYVELSSASTTFEVGENSTLTISGALVYSTDSSGAASYGIVKTGSGTLILSGVNSSSYYGDYAGTTTISAGTLQNAHGGAGTTSSSSISISAGATLSVNVSNSLEISGSLSGSGDIDLISGTTTISSSSFASMLSTLVESKATLLLNTLYAGDLTVLGTLGGNGTFSGTLTLGDSAKITVSEGDTLSIENAKLSASSSTTLTKNGAGTLVVSSGIGFEVFNLNAGTLISSGTTSAPTLNISGGTLDGAWLVSSFNVLGNGEIAGRGGAELETVAGEAALNFSNYAQLTVAGTLSTSGKNTMHGSGTLLIDGGSVSAASLTISSSSNVSEISLSNSGTLSISNGVNIYSGTTISASGSTISLSGALNFYADSTIRYGTLELGDGAVFYVEDGVSVSISSTISANEISKTGAGTLKISSSLEDFSGTISVSEGTLALTNSADVSASKIYVENATLTAAGTLSVASGTIFLTNEASVSANLKISGNSKLVVTDSEISGRLTIVGNDAGASETLYVTFGNSTVSKDVVISGDAEISFTGTLTVGGDFSWENTSAGTIDISSLGAVGSSYVLVAADSISISEEILAALALVGNKTGQELVIEISGTNLVISAYGTKIWNGASEWSNDAGEVGEWLVTNAGSDPSESKFYTDDYVEFNFTGTDGNEISVVSGGVSIGSASFVGADSSSEFVVNFTGTLGILNSSQKNSDGETVETIVSIRSGNVIFSGTANHTFAGGLYISSGATLTVDGEISDSARLGTGTISLGGTLALLQDASISNDFEITSSSAEIYVETEATISGTISGEGYLTKSGAGTLTIGSDTEISALFVDAGTLNISAVSGATEIAISTISVAADATLQLLSGTALTEISTLNLSGTAIFEGPEISTFAALNITDGALLFAETIDGGNATISASGASTIQSNVQLSGALAVFVEAEGTLTISGAVSDSASASEDFSLAKSGTGTLVFQNSYNSAAAISFSAGTISFLSATTISGDVNAAGAGTLTLEFAADSTIGTSETTLRVADSVLKIAVSAGMTTVEASISASGTIQISTENSAEIVFAGTTNSLEVLNILGGATLTIADSVESFLVSDRIQLRSAAVLNVEADLSEKSAGTLVVWNKSTVNVASGAAIAFGNFGGYNTTSSTSFSLTGAGTMIVGFDGETNSAANLKISIEEEATLINAGTLELGTINGAGTLENTGTLYVSSASDNFSGTLKISAGTAYFYENASIKNGEIELDAAGTLVIVGMNDVSIGEVDDATQIAATLSGDGTLGVSGAGTSLSFASGTISNFTGTLWANDEAVLKFSGVAAESSVSKILLTNAGVLSVEESAISLGKSKTLEIENGVVSVAENSTLTIAGTTEISSAALFNGAGTTVLAGTISAAGATIYVTAGTLKISSASNHAAAVVYDSGTLIFDSEDSLGSDGATILLSAGTVKFAFDSSNEISNEISGAGTIKGAGTLTLTAISANFSGNVTALEGELTLKISRDTLFKNSVILAAEEGATLKISTADLDDDETEIEDGGAILAGAGTIILDIGSGKTLSLSNANSELSGTLEVASGTLEVSGSSASLGNAEIVLDSDTVLEVTGSNSFYLNNSVSGAGTLVKSGSGTVLVGGEIAVDIFVEKGILAISEISGGNEISISSGATLELSYVYDESTGTATTRDSGDVEFYANYTVEGMATFANSASNATSTVSGTLSGAYGAAIVLYGGGAGSTFALSSAETLSALYKTGSGTWIVSGTISAEEIAVNGGTLAVENYSASLAESVSIASGATLEILSFNGDAAVGANISGSGTLKISASEEITLVIDENSSSTWKLEIGETANVTISSDVANTIVVDKGGNLIFDVSDDDEIEVSGAISAAAGSTISKTGAGTLVISGDKSISSIACNFEIEEGIVVVKSSLGSSGSVDVASGATLVFDLGEDNSLVLSKTISGSGTLEVASGTLGIRAQSSFEGDVLIDEGATLVLGGTANVEASLGAGTITVEGTLEVAQKLDNSLSNFAGSGTIVIKNSSENYVTTISDFDDFDGNFVVEVGGLGISADDLASFENDVSLSGESASLVISNSGESFELTSAMLGNVSAEDGASVVFEGAFYAAAGTTFGVENSTLTLASGTTLALESGAAALGNLYVKDGGHLIISAENSGADLSGTTISAAMKLAAETSSGTTAISVSVEGWVKISGALTIYVNEENYAAGTAVINSTEKVTVDSTALVTIYDESGKISSGETLTIFESDEGDVTISRFATFQTGDGVLLEAAVTNDGTTIVVGEYVSVAIPSGLEELADLLSTNSAIGNAIWGSGTKAEQNAKLMNFSPVSFGALSEISMELSRHEIELLRNRLEQRRYDSAVDPEDATGKAFATAFGKTSATSKNEDKARNYDTTLYGVVAGVDARAAQDLLLGASVAYQNASSKIHNDGGKHTADSGRVGAYGMYMLDEVSFLGFGASLGVSSYDTKRKNALETLKGDTTGTDFEASITLGRMFALSSDLGLHISPFIGAEFAFTSIKEFEEHGGTESALNVDGYDRTSLRGIVGASFNWLASESFRLGIEVAFAHEFLDTDSEINATFSGGEYAGTRFVSTAYFGGENVFSVGPRIDFRLDESWALSAAYTFETDLGNSSAHSANIGIRCNF